MVTGLYRGIWRYASLPDLFSITRAVTLTVLIFLFSGAALLSLDGCGGSSAPSSESPTSYEISVMASSGSLHHSASVSLAVK